jgi:ABC-type transport system involved in cytochrome bd biosynthesis fused ATPase/permease subunit
VAERLRQATGEGRLLAEELEQRLGAVFRARTYGELDALVADLPSGRQTPARTRSRPLARVRTLPAPALVVLVPMAMAIAVAAVVVVATMFMFWALMVTIVWLAFGHRRPYYPPMRYYRRTMRHAYGRWLP